jgi:glycosyltransferase involved in cell wall biosynthesis
MPAPGPLPLSVAIVCKDNERTIGRTLESVRELASEIVAVDSGSTDGTIGLLEAARARVISSAWLGHVKTKQKALEACSLEWVLSVDSDESVEPDLAAAIRAAFASSDGSVHGYEVNRRVYYRGRPLRHAWQPERRLRLVWRSKARWSGLDPHDKLELAGDSPRPRVLTGVLRHDSFETFAEHFRAQARHAETMARSLHAAGKRGSVLRLVTSPPAAFLKQVVVKRAFLDGYAGILAGASTAAGALMKHACLIELSRGARRG